MTSDERTGPSMIEAVALLTGPAGVIAGRELRVKERAENFPVALAALPRRYSTMLRAIYDVVRTIDELGDSAEGDRSVALRDFAADVDCAWAGGQPRSDVLVRMVALGAVGHLPVDSFHRLIEANLQDQVVARYPTFDDLLGYCALSAAPVGRLVLATFGVQSARAGELSDQVCSALQLLEHWQDVGEDRRAGRIYLPQADLRAYGVPESDLDARVTSDRLRRLIVIETERAERMLAAGDELIPMLHGCARLAVTGYVAGGRATAQALRRCRGDVLAGHARPRRVDLLRQAVSVARRAR